MEKITREYFEKLDKKIDDLSLTQLTFHGSVHEDLKTIKRGIYGDEKNEVKGLIERQNADDEKIKRLHKRIDVVEKKQNWFMAIASGLMIGLQLAANYFKEIFR